MARLRTVKSEFWTSEQIVNCSRDARLLFIGLWNFCDDAGIHPASHLRLKMEVLPADNITENEIKKLIDELIRNGLLYEYEVDAKKYWQVSGWFRHQKIDRPTYRYPKPNEKNDDFSTNTQLQVADNSSPSRRVLADSSGRNRVEQNRAEKEDIRKVANATSPVDDENSICSKNDTLSLCVQYNPLPATLPLPNEDIGNIDGQQELKKASVDVTSDQKAQQNEKVSKIFKFWQETMSKPKAILDNKRRSKILAALKLGYTVEQIFEAVTGCYRTPFNMGKNDRGQKYDDIALILRDSEHIEKFMVACDDYESYSHSAYSDIIAGAL